MTLRAIFNNSVDDGNKVFANVSSKNDAETNLTTRDDILTVANASMSQYPALARVRDMFMFSFYTCGTSFERMKLMTLNDITDDYINIPDGRKIIRLSCMDRLLPDKKSDSNAPLFPLPIHLTSTNTPHDWASSAATCNYSVSSTPTPRSTAGYHAQESAASTSRSLPNVSATPKPRYFNSPTVVTCPLTATTSTQPCVR